MNNESVEDVEYKIEVDDSNLRLNVLSTSNRFATIETTGMIVSINTKSPGSSVNLTETIDGIYNLKKDPISGEWKIYNFSQSLLNL